MNSDLTRRNGFAGILLVLLLFPAGHSQSEAKSSRGIIFVIGALVVFAIYETSQYLSEDSFTSYGLRQVKNSQNPFRHSAEGISNYEEKRWIVSYHQEGASLKPEFKHISWVEPWWKNHHIFSNPESRVKSLIHTLDGDYEDWKFLKSSSSTSSLNFVEYSSLIASNCEAMDNGSFIKAFHASERDILNNRDLCKRWLNGNIQWRGYFASDFNRNIPLVLIPAWSAEWDNRSVQAGVGYLFNARYDFSNLRDLYRETDVSLQLIGPDANSYRIYKLGWDSWSIASLLAYDHEKVGWHEHSYCQLEGSHCTFDNFYGSADHVTPYLLHSVITQTSLLIFNHGDELTVWRLGEQWSEKKKRIQLRVNSQKFQLTLD
jgi:hypothetical protein